MFRYDLVRFSLKGKKTQDHTETLDTKAIPNPIWAVRNSSLASVINTKNKNRQSRAWLLLSSVIGLLRLYSDYSQLPLLLTPSGPPVSVLNDESP